jgi:hypothetical protein
MPLFPQAVYGARLSYCRAIDLIVCLMCSHKPDINGSDIKEDQSYNAVVVAPDIKNKPIISYGIDRIEHSFYLMIICPIRLCNQPVPIVERVFRISVLLKKVP